MDWDSIYFNASAFAAGLFLLEFGADRFIDHTAIVARRIRVSQTLVALLTAGAEWEENILGAFSLGLLVHPGYMTFDRSAKVYAALLFLVTTVFTAVALTHSLGRVTGAIFIAVFALYLASVGYGIYKGVLDAPEDVNSDSDDDSYDSSIDGNGEEAPRDLVPDEVSPLLPNGTRGEQPPHRPKHGLVYHGVQLILGFIALLLSGYVLSHSAASIGDAFNLSGTVLGVTVLALATTLPEKFIAVMGGARGHGGIVVASTAGSNIFLLTLCLGITFVAGKQEELSDSVVPFELLVTWASSALFLPIVFFGSRPWVGGVLLVLYIAFIVLEFTVYRR